MAVAPVSSADTADFTFMVADLDPHVLKVLGFEGTEGISELYRFKVELCSDDANLDLAALLGKPCSLEIYAMGGLRRYVNGIVQRFERTGHGSGLTYYVAEIVPSLWLLTKRRQSRIFQEVRCADMTVPGVIAQVIEDAGITRDYFHPPILRTDYETREFIAQYRESDFDFISRLMEQEGIFYFFEHAADRRRMVIGDDDTAHKVLPEVDEFPYRDPNGLVEEQEYVFGARDAREIQHGAVYLDDFNFRGQENAMWMRGERSGDLHTALVYNDYPGDFETKETGARYAQVRLEEYGCVRQVVHLAATIRTLVPGYRFRLVDHPTDEMNREYLITHVSHRARQIQSAEGQADSEGTRYEAQIRAIPAEIPFRPPRKTPRPVIIGSQTAVVVGPDTEEIWTDDEGYGRVKVRFHWDRNGDFPDSASCWVRVSQGWAGGGYGMLFLPRVGQEVIVDFLEGNPSRPLITGRVYNQDNLPPYLPDEKTKSTIKTRSSKDGEGANEIRFEDLKDEEQLLFHAQKDLHVRVKNDRVENVERDLHLTVDNNRNELVKADRSLKVEGNLKEEIVQDVSTDIQGKESKNVDGTLSLSVRGDVVESLGSNHKHEVTQTYAASAMSIKLEGSTEIELACGASSIQLTSAGIFISGTIVNINSGSGPPVAPVTALATTPEAPEAPVDADQIEYGTDVRYTGQEQEFDRVEVEPLAGGTERVPREVEEKTWIAIELVDEADQPVPSERYEVKLPDGRIRKGSLDSNGHARISGLDPGTCQICFPNLDAEAGERI